MIELPKAEIAGLGDLYAMLKDIPMHFIVTIDDLTFTQDDETYADRSATDVNKSDAVDESMSLADRFGLFITFTQPNREIYFDIVRQLAEDMDIEIDDSELTQAAERFALKRGGRSPRIARQFVDWLNARIELGLDY